LILVIVYFVKVAYIKEICPVKSNVRLLTSEKLLAQLASCDAIHSQQNVRYERALDTWRHTNLSLHILLRARPCTRATIYILWGV